MVYILGDISLRGNKEELISLVSILKGRKVLVKGNHDDLSDYRYSQLFYEICDYKEVTDCCNGKNYNLILSHYPIFSWKKMGRGYILLYGHTHNSPEDIYYQKCLQEMNNNDCRHIIKSAPTAINVGCMKEYMDYTPRTFKEIYEKVINNG
jgi:calcineurin-like phosphoesterase family protein